MKKLKGPELKLPPVLRDLYQDLRDRHLLPLVGLLLVAIIAAPILLSDSDKAPEPAPAGPRAGGPAEASAALTVVRAAPGLRAPRKRLEHRTPADPFKQQYVSPPLSEESVTVEGSTEPETESGGGAPVTNAPVTSVHSGLIYFTSAVTVRIVRSETKEDGEAVHEEPIVRTRVLPTTTLLGEKAQIVTYMGRSPKTKNPTFLISDKVTAVFGEGNCLAGTERCELIELEEDEPEVFVYGANDIRYRITVLATEIVETDERSNLP